MVKNLPAMQEIWVQSLSLGRSSGEGHGNPLQYSCLENPNGQRSLADYSPWGHKESDTTKQLSTAQCQFPMLPFSVLCSETTHSLGCITSRNKLQEDQFSSRPTLCDPMDCSMTGFPVHHQLPELAQIHVHWVGDAVQPSHPLSSPSPTFNLSWHQGLFQWVSSSHQVAKVLEFQPQHQSFQWIFRTDFL